MASKISIECPGCSAKLSLSDSSKLGKKIKCPKCQEIFLPEPSDDEVIDDEDDEPKQPSSKKKGMSGSAKGSSKKSKKGDSSSGGSSAPLIIGGVVGLLVLVGAGLFFAGVFNRKPVPAPVAAQPAPVVAPPVVAAPAPPALSQAEKVLGLRWMPAETDFIVHAKVGEIWQAPLLKGPLSDPSLAMGLQEFQNKLGVLPAEVETVSIGVVDLSGAGIRMIANTPNFGAPQAPPAPPEQARYVLVLKTKKPLDINLIAKGIPNATLQEKSGKKYFAVPPTPPFTPETGGWSPEPSTLIMGTTTELFAAMDRGETVIPRKEFALIDHTPQLVIATAIRGLKKEELQSLEAKEKELPGAIVAAIKANEQFSLQLVGIALSVKGGFDLKLFAASGTADGANKIKEQLEGYLAVARSGFDSYKKTGIPLISELGEMVLANLKIESMNQTVKVSTSIPDSEQTKLEQLPQILMLMAMTGGFNGLGGPAAAVPMNASVGNVAMSQPAAPIAPVIPTGETEPVDPAKVDGLPDGLKLSARTAWSSEISEGTKTVSIEILFDVTGDGLETICGAGGISTKTMKLEGGGSLKKAKQAGFDPQKLFILYDAKNEPPSHYPPQTLRVRMVVDAPTKAVAKIDVLEGTFKMLSSTGTQEMTIDEVPRKIKKPLNDPEFKALEIKWRRGPSGAAKESYALFCGKEHFLGLAHGSPGDITSVTELDKDQTVQRLYSNHDGGKFPDDFQIKFTIHPHVKEHEVTFRFENVPLPSADSKPQPQ